MPYIARTMPCEKLSRLIRGYCTPPTLAQVLKCAPATARKKLEEPTRFTTGDLLQIHNGLHIPMEELREAIQR